MSATVLERPAEGGLAARRAVTRWAWRMFRREWRRQLLVLVLLGLAVAVTCAGLGVVSGFAVGQAGVFGAADHRLTLDARSADLPGDLAALRATFGTVETIDRRQISVPGSATPIDVRGQAAHGPLSAPMLRLTAGRFPAGPGEAAVTARAARAFGLHLGGAWTEHGHTWSIVGTVENPNDLLDTFVLVAPGQAGPLTDVIVLLSATDQQFSRAALPDGAAVEVRSAGERAAATAAVLGMATVGLLFVGLLAVAGFTVLAQRRLRALGMLGAVGASPRHVRLVPIANGAATGVVAALAGTVLGLGAWFLLAPALEGVVEHRIDRFALPWWAVGLTAGLAVLTAVVAAWWPARAVARVPIVAALASRPARPRPAHRFAIAGLVLLPAGLGLLAAAQREKPVFIVSGVVAIVAGMLLLAPLGITLLGLVARVAPVAVRLALRDLARYRARSGAALAAVSLAAGIAAAIVLGSAAVQAAAVIPATAGNLAADQVIVWSSASRIEGPVPELPADRLHSADSAVSAVAAIVGAGSALPLQVAYSPDAPLQDGGHPVLTFGLPHRVDGGRTRYSGEELIPVYVATPELLRYYGIGAVDPGAEVLTSRASLDGYDLLGRGRREDRWQPVRQRVALPAYTSGPSVLITPKGMRALGVRAMPTAWLLRAPRPLTPDQVDQMRSVAGGAGLTVETRPARADLSALRLWAVLAGIVVALGVLAMTVGLIRSETGRDLRTLTAAGAPSGTRRTLTAATAAALAVLGAVLGVVGAYTAVIALYHHDLHLLVPVPIVPLAGLLLGLPLLAVVAGWLAAGREPAGIARSPLD
ncbi:hypothetical protein L3i22_066330 [Actinoplanes sp. L3-i22]|nr:hypothetical protein L3i22_066330 [Actinoplanes sp. L3-i22]